MIPDKIYILCCDNGDLGDASLYPEGERSKEYIRKDALLEWAKREEGLPLYVKLVKYCEEL